MFADSGIRMTRKNKVSHLSKRRQWLKSRNLEFHTYSVTPIRQVYKLSFKLTVLPVDCCLQTVEQCQATSPRSLLRWGNVVRLMVAICRVCCYRHTCCQYQAGLGVFGCRPKTDDCCCSLDHPKCPLSSFVCSYVHVYFDVLKMIISVNHSINQTMKCLFRCLKNINPSFRQSNNEMFISIS